MTAAKRICIAAGLAALVLAGVYAYGLKTEKMRLSFDVRAEKPFVCEIFFSDDPAAPFKFSKKAAVSKGGNSLDFVLEAARLRKLRVDFGSAPGRVDAGPVRIRAKDGRELVLDWARFTPSGDVDARSLSPGGRMEIKSGKRDPYLVYGGGLDFPATAGQGRELSLDIMCFSLAGIFAWLILSAMPRREGETFVWGFVRIAMAVQLGLMSAWMLFNLGGTPTFGDAREYLNLSRSLAVDEYRPVGYPVVVGCAVWLEGRIHLPHVFFIYIFQAAVQAAAAIFAVSTIARLFPAGALARGASPADLRFAALYAASFPLCGMMCFAGMSDSLALSATMVYLAAMLAVFHGERGSVRPYAAALVAFCAGSMVRGDRPYLFLLTGLAAAVFWLVRGKGRRRAALCFAATLACAFAAVATVNRLTQQPGLYGRPRTTLDFVLLDRIVWPHMTECYDSFPAEVKRLVSRDDARNFDENNNNVMYVFAPKLEKRVGEERAHELYRTMAGAVFRARPGEVLGGIAHDVAKVMFAPFCQLAGIYDTRCHEGRRCINPYCYNPRCFEGPARNLARAANAIPLHLFAAAFLFAIAALVKSGGARRRLAASAPALAVFFGFSLALAIFYSLGDGALPNSRYSTIVDVSWVLALLALAPKTEKEAAS